MISVVKIYHHRDHTEGKWKNLLISSRFALNYFYNHSVINLDFTNSDLLPFEAVALMEYVDEPVI